MVPPLVLCLQTSGSKLVETASWPCQPCPTLNCDFPSSEILAWTSVVSQAEFCPPEFEVEVTRPLDPSGRALFRSERCPGRSHRGSIDCHGRRVYSVAVTSRSRLRPTGRAFAHCTSSD